MVLFSFFPSFPFLPFFQSFGKSLQIFGPNSRAFHLGIKCPPSLPPSFLSFPPYLLPSLIPSLLCSFVSSFLPFLFLFLPSLLSVLLILVINDNKFFLILRITAFFGSECPSFTHIAAKCNCRGLSWRSRRKQITMFTSDLPPYQFKITVVECSFGHC